VVASVVIDAALPVMLFFMFLMATPLVLYFAVPSFSKNRIMDFVVRRFMLVLTCLFGALASAVTGVLSVKGELGVEDFAYMVLELMVLAFTVGMIVLSFVTVRDYMRANKLNKEQGTTVDEDEGDEA